MQVNNTLSPNFGMALKIKPNAKKLIPAQDLAYKVKLLKFEDEFKDYKYTDLVINDDLTPMAFKRDNAEFFYDKFEPRYIQADGKLGVMTKRLGPKIVGIPQNNDYELVLDMGNFSRARHAYDVLRRLHLQSRVDAAAIFTRFLEESQNNLVKKGEICK